MRTALTWSALALGIAPSSPLAAFDLAAAEVTRLANGLTLLVLEDHVLPVVSVQMLYRAGARDEAPGTTGVAHFMEHMAFRASEGFPETELASRIYAVGGEWHAYTWIDQTTYYETAPREHLDLLLRIEADRMARLLLPAGEVEAERGAVLAELHGYENDPASVLYDAVVATSFVQHPYRYNTIGWESDVEAITRRDLLAFYRRHYAPANAVLAVVGDIDAAAVADRVEELFSSLPSGAPTALPRTREPAQRGLRRVEIEGAGSEARFALAWRAPAATDPDWPAFLLLREVLGGGDGVNFQQESFGVPVRGGTRLASLPADATTWFAPTAQPYVLVVAGAPRAGVERARIEAAIEEAAADLRDAPVGEEELAAARSRLAETLLFDLQTTEDAAHQLAYFAGIDAREALLRLPDDLAAVGPQEVQRAARRWLAPETLTIGWSAATTPAPAVVAPAPAAEDTSTRLGPQPAGDPPDEPGTGLDGAAGRGEVSAAAAGFADLGRAAGGDSGAEAVAAIRSADVSAAPGRAAGGDSGANAVTAIPSANGSSEPGRAAGGDSGAEAVAAIGSADVSAAPGRAAGNDSGAGGVTTVRLAGGLPVLVREIPGRGTVFVGALLPTDAVGIGAEAADVVAVDDPVWRHTWLGWQGPAAKLGELIDRARAALGAAAGGAAPASPPEEDDPAAMTAAALRRQLGIVPAGGEAAPVLLVVAGDVESRRAVAQLALAFDAVRPGRSAATASPRVRTAQSDLLSRRAAAQAHLGWAVPAPGARHPDHAAWRLLLYVLTHGYEGRLGVEAIARRGLLYWIGSTYHSDGADGWIELSMAVDADKQAPLETLLREVLDGLATDPPSAAELAEAKTHLVGRRISAAQSPAEIAAFLAAEWIAQGRIRTALEVAAQLDAVTPEDVLRALPAFTAGALVRVRVP